MVIYKYRLDITDTYIPLDLPLGARVVSAGWQGEDLCLWALVDEHEKTTEPRTFTVAGTGHEFPCVYVGDVFHVRRAAGPSGPFLELFVFEAKQ
jgi:hypothetical protein